jgi:hypothetical protein
MHYNIAGGCMLLFELLMAAHKDSFSVFGAELSALGSVPL